MFCPNYKNKQVFDGFNEIIEAFGGRPMTEEEFRSPELRRQRSGRDYSAMEAAYITYDRNGGYFLDETPQGKPSLLFQTLLSHFGGDRNKAIVAKSNVYSDEFFNWFGDWTKITDKNYKYKIYDLPENRYLSNEELMAVRNDFYSGKDIVVYAASNDVESLLNGIDFRKNQPQWVNIDENAFYASYTLGYAMDYANQYANQKQQDLNKIGLVKITLNNDNGHVSLNGESEIKIYPGANVKSIEQINEPKNIRKIEVKNRKHQKVSKVVDENGEPLVVWHTSTENFSQFDKTKAAYPKGYNELGYSPFFSEAKPTDKAFFFSTDVEYTKRFGRGSDTETSYPVYLSIKNNFDKQDLLKAAKQKHPELDDDDLLELSEQFYGYYSYDDNHVETYKDPDIFQLHTGLVAQAIGVARHYGMKIDGFIGKDVEETHRSTEFAVLEPNQIKHVENLGTWNPNTNNIYHLKKDISFDEDKEYFNAADIVSSFGQDLSQKLMNGETVSSRDLMQQMIINGIFHSADNKLARALSLHDVPVRIGYSMKNGELAKTITDGDASVIFINPNELNQVSKGYIGTTMMHELVHAITVDIIDYPKTQADFEFVKANRDIFNRIAKSIPHLEVHSRNVIDGMYALTNEKEFAACFASDPVVRAQICGLAEKIDRLNRKSNILSHLKKLVNIIAKAFSKRAIFEENSLVRDVNEYEKVLTDYLIGVPTIEKGNVSKSKLKKVYAEANKEILNHEDFIESMKMLEKMSELQKNYIRRDNIQAVNINDVEQMLKTRVQALKKSVIDAVEKGKLISTTENQLEMFVIDEAGKYEAVANLLRTSVPQIIDTIDQLRSIRREGGKFTNAEYMYQMHANIGMYNQAYDTIQEWLVDDNNKIRMVQLYNEKNSEKITIDDVIAMEQNLKNAKSFSEEAIHVLDYMLKANGINTLKNIAKRVGYKDIDKYIETLNTDDANLFAEDISALELLGGASDASANDAVRALSYIINRALNKAQFKTNDKETDLLQLQKNLKSGEKGWHLYETDENGNFTGYLIRDLNFGKFKRDYNEMIKSINNDLIKHFGLVTLDLNNRVAPDGEAGKRVAIVNGREFTAKQYFEEKKDVWLNQHCERRYKPEYYEHYSKLPQRVKDQLGAIRTQINAITSNYKDLYDEKGVPHYEQLSDEDWIKLNTLWERRKFMRSPINEYGFKREGQDYDDAKALADLYEVLYKMPNPFKNQHITSERKEKKKFYNQWLAARNEIISKYGENSEELEKWDERNSKKTLKRNEFDEVLVFLEIEKEFGEYELDWGEEYQKLKDKKNEILSKYRMLNGEVDANSIPQVLINALVELDRQMRVERNKQKSNQTNQDKQRVAKFKEIWDKYIKYVDTVQLKKAKEDARQEARRRLGEDSDPLTDTSEEELMNIILGNTYGYIDFDDDLLDTAGTFVPYSWLQRMESVDPQFMDIEPNDAWIDKEDSELLNENFDESYGVTFVPKRFDKHGNKLYDNEENYSKIFGKKQKDGTRKGGSETLQALYDGVLNTIHESNQLQNREFADDYLLPQMECTALERFFRKSTWKGFKTWLQKVLGYGRILGLSEDPNDIDINKAFIESSEDRVETSISGVYPDGRDFHVIPTPFTRQLEHPELISKDIVGITRDYYLMSNRYHERSLVRDDCELILDLLKKQRFKEGNRFGKTRDKIVKLTGGIQGESNTFNFAKKLVERDLYDIQREPFKALGIDWSKLLSLLKRLTTARNLGMNPKVALVGFLTTMFTHTINGIVGYKYSSKDMFNAGIIAINEFGSNFAGARFVGDRLTKNKLILLLEMLDMSDQSGRKTEHSDRNRILQAIYKNSTFGIMSAADIYSKATIAVATLLSYRYVDGQFMTKHMIEEKRLTVGEEEYKRLMKEFKKSDVNAYNIFEGDSKAWKRKINSNDTKLKVKEQYKVAWEKVKHTAANKALKNAEQADGMATRLQKAMMTRNFLGAFILIHRQYIPLMLQQTWGKRVYDFDAEEYKGGQFRTLFNYVRNVACANVLSSVGAGAFVGLAFGGFAPVPIIACSALSLAYSLQHKIRNRKDKKSIKEVNKEFFGTGLGSVLNPFGIKFASVKEGQTQVQHDNEIANAYQIRQTFYEVMLINFAIAPIANLLAACADNVDKDDERWKWLLLQTLAYWARATQFETNSKYNLVDILNNVKSATAATSVTDAALAFTSGVGTSLFMSTLGFGRNYGSESMIFGTYKWFMGLFDEEEDEIDEKDGMVQGGTYQGYSETFRDIMKLTPLHNIFEQLVDPAAKRRYHETQVMKLDKFERRSWLYDWIWGYDEDEEDEE